MIKVTKAELVGLEPCAIDRRLALFGRKQSMSAKQALEAGATVVDLLWVAGRLGHKRLIVQFALEVAQRVAHNNKDPRVQAALAAAACLTADADWDADTVGRAAMRARAAAGDAVKGMAAVWDTNWPAANAANAAANAAASAAQAAANAARGTRDARNAAQAAAEAAMDAVWAAGDRAAEREAQRAIFLRIFG